MLKNLSISIGSNKFLWRLLSLKKKLFKLQLNINIYNIWGNFRQILWKDRLLGKELLKRR